MSYWQHRVHLVSRINAGRNPVVGLASAAVLIGLGACADEARITAPDTEKAASSAAAVIDSTDADTSFATMSDSLLWRYVAQTDSIARIGIRTPGKHRGFDKGERLVRDADWQGGRTAIGASKGAIIVEVDSLLPWVRVKLDGIDALRKLRTAPYVEYLEPQHMIDFRVASFCGDFSYGTGYGSVGLPSGDHLPLIYQWMHIDRAWAYAAGGRGVTIGLTDTGSDPQQPELGSLFATGQSTGRWIQWYGGNASGTQNNPSCEHGTKAAGTIAAPMNGQHIVGVAWASNLVSAYHGDDIVAGEAAAQLAIRGSANLGAKVINMSWGSGLAYSGIRQEIEYWYYNGDVVFVGAAGTWNWPGCDLAKSSNTAFPAELPEVIAVSAANGDGSRPCSASHGNEVDVVAFHRQPTTGPASAGSAFTLSSESSNSSAIVAGIVALVRQRYPSMTASQARSRVISTAGTICSKSAWHNMVNAEAAVGGLCVEGGRIIGVDRIDFVDRRGTSRSLTYSVNLSGGNGARTITWSNGATGPSTTITWQRGDYTHTVTASIRDTGSSNPPLVISKTITVHDYCDDPGVDPNAIDCSM